MTTHRALILLILPALAFLASSAAAQDRGDRGDRGDRAFSDKYSTIWLRNIFVRDRSRITQGTTGSRERPSRPEQSYLLTGIVLVEPSETESPVFLAFIEDGRAGTTKRVKAGDFIVRGKVTQMTIDGLEYESDGRSTHIAIGMNFDGGSQIVRAAYGSPSTMPSSADSGSSSGGGDLAARLRARRAQELGESPPPTPTTTDDTSPPPTPSATGAPATTDPPASDSDIAERMRQRRIQETSR